LKIDLGAKAMMDWAQLRSSWMSKERPPEWPEGVFGISLEGASLLGIHEKTGKLYWDGKEVVTHTTLRLATKETVFAIIGLAIAAGGLLVNVGRAAGWWN
jgi:hypothetical protein